MKRHGLVGKTCSLALKVKMTVLSQELHFKKLHDRQSDLQGDMHAHTHTHKLHPFILLSCAFFKTQFTAELKFGIGFLSLGRVLLCQSQSMIGPLHRSAVRQHHSFF